MQRMICGELEEYVWLDGGLLELAAYHLNFLAEPGLNHAREAGRKDAHEESHAQANKLPTDEMSHALPPIVVCRSQERLVPFRTFVTFRVPASQAK